LALSSSEDNFVNQQIALELLDSEVAQVELDNNGQEALHLLVGTNAGVLFELPVVAMTANAMDSDRAACLEAGMNDHVGKPFNMAHVVWMLLRVKAPPVV